MGSLCVLPKSTVAKNYDNANALFSHLTQKRFINMVRLKWFKLRHLDRIIEEDADLKAVCMIRDIMRKHQDDCLPVTSIERRQQDLGLTVPVMRFMRRYPKIFREFQGPKYDVPWFSLTKEALELDEEEQRFHEENGLDSIHRLCKLLMMTRSRKLPLQSIEPLQWDFGLPRDFMNTLIPRYCGHLKIIRMEVGNENVGYGKKRNNKRDEEEQSVGLGLQLEKWEDKLAVSTLEMKHFERLRRTVNHRRHREQVPIGFEMNFPKCYGYMKKVKYWMDEWQRLPYVSPYDNPSSLDPRGDVMEKRVVGVFHELLSITLTKKIQRNNLNCFCQEMSLPERFTKLFTRYPGIFYYSLKCSTSSVLLKEAYLSDSMPELSPLIRFRNKYFHLMRLENSGRSKDVY